MDHAEVAVQGQGDEEENAGPSIEKQHEEHYAANCGIIAAPHVVQIVVNFDGETGDQQKISEDDVEEEHAVVLPEFKPEDEGVEHREIKR